jgi:hypothetical protein
MNPKPFDVVALLEEIPDKGLVRGQVGTIVETLGPNTFDVEFSDNEGHTYAELSLQSNQFLVLRHESIAAA